MTKTQTQFERRNRLPENMSVAAQRLHWKLQSQVIDRAFKEIPTLKKYTNRLSLTMDLDSVEDLDLVLLVAPKFDFAHDICGIIRHMDRSSYPGTLTNCFRPRCCRS